MQGQFSKIPATTFQQLGVNAAMLLSSFNPTTGSYSTSDIIGATSGGIQFQATPEFTDWGEDIDNCPKNTKELKRLSDWTINTSGMFVTMNADLAAKLTALADNSSGHVIPRTVLDAADFGNLWIVGDYSDKNTGSTAGFIAIHLMNALSTTGFNLQTTDKGKMQFSFEFTAHYSLDAQDTVPFEIYIKAGTSSGDTPEILLDRHSATIKVGDKLQLNAVRVVPAGSTITWASSATAKASVSGGEVTGAQAGSTIITASITDDGVTYSDTCTIVVEAAS